jgi:hypothetical protein
VPSVPVSAQPKPVPQHSWLYNEFGPPAWNYAMGAEKAYYTGLASSLHVPFEPTWSVANLRTHLPTWAGGQTASAQQQETQTAKQKYPFMLGAGHVVGQYAPGIAAGEGLGAAWDVGEGILPEAEGWIPKALQVVKGAAQGAAASAVSSNKNPLSAAGYGALTGGVLSGTLGIAGAGIRALSENTPEEMENIAQTSDTLLRDTHGVKGAGVKEVLGRPNLMGEGTISRVPVARTVLGVGRNIASKAAGAEVAAAAATTGEGDWAETLANEQAFQTPQGRIDMHDPAKFGEYYPKLSIAGKKAALRGMIDNSLSVLKNGQYDLPKLANNLNQMIGQVGDQVGEDSYGGKWTLKGLHRLVTSINNIQYDPELASKIASKAQDDPNGFKKVIHGAANFIGAGAAIDLLDDPGEFVAKH